MELQKPAGASLGIAGTLEYRDKDGNVIGTTDICGRVRLADLGLSVEEAQQIINQQQGADSGTDLCK